MISYQEMILGHLTSRGMHAGGHLPKCDVSVSYDFANRGRIIVTRRSGPTTVVTADFDFQSERVNVLINNPGGPRSMMAGPRSEDVFWWTVGNPADDAEVARLYARWSALIKEGLA